MLAAGKTSPEIQAVLAERAALDLSGSPNSGASYLWPVVALIVAVLGLALVLRRLRSRAEPRVVKGEVVLGSTVAVGDARLDSELEDVR
jgi:bacteriorhodopsin